MVVRPSAERPVKPAVGFSDRVFVDAGVTRPHQAVFGKLPILVPVGPEPLAAVIVIFVGVAHRDPVARECPEFLDQAVVEFLFHLRSERPRLQRGSLRIRHDCASSIHRVGERYPGRIAAVPAIFRKADLFDGALFSERGSGGRDIVMAPGFVRGGKDDGSRVTPS